jgi:hypothetical protein
MVCLYVALGTSPAVGEPGHVKRYAAPVIAAQALLAHGIQDASILDYLANTWGLTGSDAASALAAARVFAEDADALTALPPDREPD